MTCAAPNYLERFGTPNHIDALDGHRLVGLRSLTTGTVRPLDFVVDGEVRHLELPAPFSVTGTESYLAGLRLGLGIAQAPYFHVQNDLKAGALVEILHDFPPLEIPVSLLYARSRQLSLRLRVFLDWAAREFTARNPRLEDR
jgi:DNA-binding transcriptional LysR family regulator